MTKKYLKSGPKPFSVYPSEIEKFIKETYLKLSEKDRRSYAAIEALKLPRGGKSYMADLLGCSRNTLLKGISELKNPDIVLKDRIRRKGAGRKSAIETIKNIDDVFLKVIDDYIAGDPMNGKIRWTNLSHKKIAQYPDCTSILILADGGGSNSSRHYIFKESMRILFDDYLGQWNYRAIPEKA